MSYIQFWYHQAPTNNVTKSANKQIQNKVTNKYYRIQRNITKSNENQLKKN
jgi:hypothetical protein